MSTGWHKAIPSGALAAGTLLSAVIDGRKVLLARLDDGTLAAAATVCPHQAADLSEGRLYFDGIDCPLHHYVYDLRSGENRYPRNVFPSEMAARLAPLRLFAVKEEDGWIWVGEHRANA